MKTNCLVRFDHCRLLKPGGSDLKTEQWVEVEIPATFIGNVPDSPETCVCEIGGIVQIVPTDRVKHLKAV
jgi:hypothetical protein